MLIVKEILEREDIRDFKNDIRKMSVKQLHRYFSFKSSGKLNVTNLIKNLIWQAYTWIAQGKMEIFEGNLRSFWYANVKPVLSRLGLDVSGTRYIDKVYDCFVELVLICHLFRYFDFGFYDDRAHVRTIGGKNGNLLLFIEKDGLYRIVERVAQQYDVSAISLGGFSGYLTMEYLVREMANKGLLREPVHLFGIVDYDPSGHWIGEEFQEQLRHYAVEIGSFHSLVDIDKLPEELVRVCKYRLKGNTRTRNWMKISGGIEGEEYGLEADALGGGRIRKAYEEAIQPYLGRVATMPIVDEERERFFRDLTAIPMYASKEDLRPGVRVWTAREIGDAILKLNADELRKLRRRLNRMREMGLKI